MTSYQTFLRKKSQIDFNDGFDPVWMPDFLFDFQKELVDWSIRKGRSAIFADCGLGKTPMHLVKDENIVRKTNGRVLVLTPLAVAQQTVREAEKFGIDAVYSRDGKNLGKITVTNYEMLKHFDPNDFVCVDCDESSRIKADKGKLRKQVTQFMKHIKYRGLYTATAAPNDYIEMGTSSEALGVMGQIEMLNTFFKSSDDAQHIWNKAGDFWTNHKWLFKAHAEDKFWRWVCSWAKAIRKPSDFGYTDEGFDLPPLTVKQHVVETENTFGDLFPRVAVTLAEQRQERRATMEERCGKVADLVNHDKPVIVWCHLNPEGDMLEQIIPGSRQVKGAMKDEEKEEILKDFSEGRLRCIVTKPQIAGFGLNWQHCNHMTFFPSHSFEQYYQAVRRCWRFGQKNPVHVDVITTPGEAGVTANLQSKQEKTEKLFERLVTLMHEHHHKPQTQQHIDKEIVPSWL